MTYEDMMLDGDRFVMLDVLNTISENEIASKSANIQILSPPNRNTYLDIKAIMNRFGRALKFEEKKKQVFTITLNQDAGYKTRRYR